VKSRLNLAAHFRTRRSSDDRFGALVTAPTEGGRGAVSGIAAVDLGAVVVVFAAVGGGPIGAAVVAVAGDFSEATSSRKVSAICCACDSKFSLEATLSTKAAFELFSSDDSLPDNACCVA